MGQTAQKKIVFAHVTLVLYCCAIFFFSHQPFNPDQRIFQFNDKLAHFFEYGLLGVLSARALAIASTYRLERAWLFCVLFALTDEFHQKFVSGRNSSVDDLIFDAFGALVGILIFQKVMLRRFI